MGANLEALVRSFRDKKRASLEDVRRYRRVSEEEVLILVKDRAVPLLPKMGHLGQDEIGQAVARAPYWQNGAPTCGDRPKQHSVDLDVHVPAKNQDDRNTCVAFACMAGLEYVFKRDHALRVDLSEEYANWLFMALEDDSVCSGIVETKRALSYMESYGVCPEDQLSYRTGEELREVYDCALSPPLEAKRQAVYGIGGYSLIAGPGVDGPYIGNPDYLECILLNGEPIVMAIDMAIGEEKESPDEVYDVILDDYGQPLASSGGHAMLLTGYNRDEEERPYFVFRNSWGDGDIRMSYHYVETYSRYGAVIRTARRDMEVGGYPDAVDAGSVNRLLWAARQKYEIRAGEVFGIELPRVPRRNHWMDTLEFRVETIGDSVEPVRKSEPLPPGDLLLPERIEGRAVRGGLSHVVVRAHDRHTGLKLKGIKPLLFSVSVKD